MLAGLVRALARIGGLGRFVAALLIVWAASAAPSLAAISITNPTSPSHPSVMLIVQATDSWSEGDEILFSIDSGAPLVAYLDATGMAELPHNFAAIGDYTIEATHTASGSTDSMVLTVERFPTGAYVTSSTGSDPSTVGDSVTFYANVGQSSSITSHTPTGTITFTIDGVDVDTVAINAGGGANFITSSLAIGPHTVVARYDGDSLFAVSTSGTLSRTVRAATTTALGVNNTNPAGALQPMTFDATVAPVSPGTGTPTGTVTFFVDSVATETVTLDASGVALFTVAAGFPIGSNDIDAVYNGDAGFAGSSSNTLPMEFIKGSVITLTPSVSSSVVGEPVTFALTLTGDGAPIVGGFVYLTDEGYSMPSTTTNASGQANFPMNTLVVGPHTISAAYSPDPGDEFAYSRVELAYTVNQASTTTTLTSDTNPSNAGQSVTFTATVTVDAPGSGAPTGVVSFYDGATLLGIAPVVAGAAALPTTALVAGARSISAVYEGDASFTGSTSSPALTQTVSGEATTTTLSATPNPSSIGENVTFTATVSGGLSTPTGTITFSIDGTDVVPDVALTAGLATFQTSSLTLGTRNVVATYNGDSTHAISSDTASQVVAVVPTTTVLTSSQNPSNLGQAITFTATVSGAGGTPTGTVTFLADNVQFGIVPLTGAGGATYTTSGFGAGSYEIVARYNGDATFGASPSDPVTQVVNALGSVAIAVTTDGADASFGFTSTTSALTLSVDTAGGTGNSGAVSLLAGNYSVNAQSMAGAGFALSGIACDDSDSTGDAGTGVASIALAAGEAVTCTFAYINSRDAATDLIEDFFDARAEIVLSHGPSGQRRIDRLNGIVPATGSPASALMGLMPMVTGGGPRSLSGSLGAIEQAVTDRAEPAPFDIWFEGTLGLYASDSGAGSFGVAYLGADYLVSPDLLVGALFQLDQVGFDASTGDASAEGTGWMIGPYVTGRLGDSLYFDVRAAAGRSTNSLSPYGTYTDEVDASRWLVDASISGQWSDGTWTFEPAARLSYFEETSDEYTDSLGIYVPSVTSGTGQLALGPALSYRFVTDGEVEVVTGARLDGVLDFSVEDSSPVYDGAHAELEASIDLSLPGGARLGASVDVGGFGEGDFRFLSGTVSVSAAIQ